jgi:Uma2 family endonuclease
MEASGARVRRDDPGGAPRGECYARDVSAVAKKVEPAATLDDLLAIPEEERRHELIEGALADKGATSGEHAGAQCKVIESIGPFHRKPGGRWPGGWWFGAEADVSFDPANTFRPDVAGWRRERVPERPKGPVIHVRPDWVCEILSTNKSNDLVRKKRVYHRHAVPHYWILDPERATLTVYRWSRDGYVEILAAERGERVRAEPFEAVEMSVGVLLGEDDEEDEGP